MLQPILYLRSLSLALFVALHTFVCSIVVITLLLIRAPKKYVDLAIGPLWCGTMLKVSNLEIETHGVENVPHGKGFLYLFTHSSHLDIPTLFYSSPKSFRFGAKDSLFKIPIFGSAIRLAGTLPITREDRSKVMGVYRQAEKRVAAGEAFALSPEGGRRSGDEIKDFKSGPFIFAINAKMPIVPVVICGVDRALPNGSLLINKRQWKQKAGVTFLPPIDVEKYGIEQVRVLKNQVRDQMVTEFNRMKKIYL